MSAARLIAALEAAKTLIETGWTPKAPDAVIRHWVPTINLTDDQPPTHEGRKVYLFGSWTVREQLTRESQLREYKVRPLVVERYAGDPGGPPACWVDERVLFFDRQVFSPLADPALKLLGTMTPDWENAPAEVDEVADRDLLLLHKTFWSYGTITFVEETTNTGEPST